MTQKPQHFYEFDGIRLFPDHSRLIRVRDGAQSFIRPKERDFLLALLKKPQETVTYAELQREVWPEVKDVKAVLPTMRETKRSLSELLKDLSQKHGGLIQTVIGQGYRLNAHVTEEQDEGERLKEKPPSPPADDLTTGEVKTSQTTEPLQPLELRETPLKESEVILSPEIKEAQAPKPEEVPSSGQTSSSQILAVSPRATSKFVSLLGGHHWHVLISCTLYSLLYVVALLLEIAYQFDRFGAMAVRFTPIIFFWVFTTSLAGLSIDAKWTLQSRAKGLIIALLCLIGSALMLYSALCSFLPGYPITESIHQSQTAQGAYLKNVLYFLPLAIIFILLPYHFVVSLQREMRAGKHRLVHDLLLGKRRSLVPENTIYLKVWWLVLLLSGAAVTSLVFTFYMLDHLKPGLYTNLFTQLAFWRIMLYFALGLECLIWYAQALNALKRDCLNASGVNPLSQVTLSPSSLSDRDAL